MVSRTQEMTTDPKEILHHAVGRRETLQMDRRLEASHLALTLSRRLMRHLGAVVCILIRTVDHRRHHGPVSRRITTELVGDQSSRHTTLPSQQFPEEPHRGPTISTRLHEDVAVLVHGAPEILLAAAPLTDGLVGDGDAPLGQQVLDIPEAEPWLLIRPLCHLYSQPDNAGSGQREDEEIAAHARA